MRKASCGLLAALLGLSAIPDTLRAESLFRQGFESTVYVRPEVYPTALRNPMKGMTTMGVRTGSQAHEWATLAHVYFKWNELENSEQDGLDRILTVSNSRFGAAAQHNIKIIPRVYLHWDGELKYWPADMQPDDYTSPQFQQRVTRLVQRLGQAWNTDSRVAFVEMGIFGKWGEQHSPSPTAQMQQVVGEAFANAFPDKKVSVRHPWSEFREFGFGGYWDSWGHQQQMWGHGTGIEGINLAHDRYLSNYIGGEVAYNWGQWTIQPGLNPTASVSDPVHREFIKNSIRWLHGTQLRWIASYDATNATARAGAEQIQRVMGYRFLLEHVEFSGRIDSGRLRVELGVRNEGSAPFYQRWPVELALHHPQTRAIVWRSTVPQADIRSWTPGQGWTPPQFEAASYWPQQVVRAGWSTQPLRWAIPPRLHLLAHEFPVQLPAGSYVLSVAILDPAGMRPSLRFATRNYWQGGRHPIGRVGVGQSGGPLPAAQVFDDPAADQTLSYDVLR